MHGGNFVINSNKFQSPKGRLQTLAGKEAFLQIPLFQSPKGRLQTEAKQTGKIPILVSFNPQRGGYKLILLFYL